MDEWRQLVSPLLQRALTEILAIEAQEIECDKARARRARLCAQGPKSECPSGRIVTASPSIRALSAAKLQTAPATCR